MLGGGSRGRDFFRGTRLGIDSPSVCFSDVIKNLESVLSNFKEVNRVGARQMVGGENYVDFMSYLKKHPEAEALLRSASNRLGVILCEIDKLKQGEKLSENFPDCLFGEGGVVGEMALAYGMKLEDFIKEYGEPNTKK